MPCIPGVCMLGLMIESLVDFAQNKQGLSRTCLHTSGRYGLNTILHNSTVVRELEYEQKKMDLMIHIHQGSGFW